MPTWTARTSGRSATFFYRQMTPLIQRGYIYIAQPPLYKVKKDKKEMYLDTDEALDKWLLAEGMDEVELYLLKGKLGEPIEPKQTLADHTEAHRTGQPAAQTSQKGLVAWTIT